MERLGLPSTLLGVDAVRDGELAGADLTEGELLALVRDAPAAHIVVTVIGGQGHIFGRGNQQISPAVIRAVAYGPHHRHRHADQAAQPGGPAAARRHGRPALDEQLSGYAKVDHGPRRAHDVQGRRLNSGGSVYQCAGGKSTKLEAFVDVGASAPAEYTLPQTANVRLVKEEYVSHAPAAGVVAEAVGPPPLVAVRHAAGPCRSSLIAMPAPGNLHGW